MPNYRRATTPGATYFFTVVTDGRMRILDTVAAVAILRDVLMACQARWPWRTIAAVVLPDHLHAIWALPQGDGAYAVRWAWIKKEFSRRWCDQNGRERVRSRGRIQHRRRGVWQPRFWEHTIRDEHDLERHVDYVVYNPVHHDLVRCPHAWRLSSFHRLVRERVYPADWGCACERPAGELRFDDIAATARE